MASRENIDDVVALVTRLADAGKSFSIRLEPDDGLLAESVRKGMHNFVRGGGDCIEWVQVPGVGLVCAKRASG